MPMSWSFFIGHLYTVSNASLKSENHNVTFSIDCIQSSQLPTELTHYSWNRIVPYTKNFYHNFVIVLLWQSISTVFHMLEQHLWDEHLRIFVVYFWCQYYFCWFWLDSVNNYFPHPGIYSHQHSSSYSIITCFYCSDAFLY